MNTPKRQPAGSHRLNQGALAPGDSLLPWADPYIAHLERQYQLDQDELEVDRVSVAALRAEMPRWTASDSPRPRTVNRLARTAVGWAMRRTAVRECTRLPRM